MVFQYEINSRYPGFQCDFDLVLGVVMHKLWKDDFGITENKTKVICADLLDFDCDLDLDF